MLISTETFLFKERHAPTVRILFRSTPGSPSCPTGPCRITMRRSTSGVTPTVTLLCYIAGRGILGPLHHRTRRGAAGGTFQLPDGRHVWPPSVPVRDTPCVVVSLRIQTRMGRETDRSRGCVAICLCPITPHHEDPLLAMVGGGKFNASGESPPARACDECALPTPSALGDLKTADRKCDSDRHAAWTITHYIVEAEERTSSSS